jgi:hypothetical protein
MNYHFYIRRILAAVPLWILAAMLLTASMCRADDAQAHHRAMENRFLFLIDTSAAMKSRTNGLAEAVTELLASDMKGELRKGDTIGLWTYSDRLSTDFPMQVWSEKKKDDIINTVREHLRILVYESRAHLEKAWPAIQQVVTNSERLTVILIFDGADSIKGTPFDKDLNKLHKQYAREFRSAHQPFVTILAARDGKIFDYIINHPDSVMVPHLADPLPPPATNEPPLVAVAPPAPAVTVPPPARIQINLSGDDFPHHTAVPPSSAAPTPTDVTPAPAPAPAPDVTSNAPPPTQATPTGAKAAQTVPTVNTNVATSAPSPGDSTPPSAPAGVVPAPSPPLPAAPALEPPAPAAPAAVAASSFQQVAMMIMAFSLLTIAVALVVLLVWRWRARSQPSLISQSIDRSR